MMPTYEELEREILDDLAEPRWTCYDRPRLRMLWDCVQAVRELPGDIVELGVFRGGTARLLCRAAPERRVFLFDTFEGFPPRHPIDYLGEGCQGAWTAGAFDQTSEALVRGYLADCPNAIIRAGKFPETLWVRAGVEPTADLPAAAGGRLCLAQAALVHFDADLYRTLADAIGYLWPVTAVGGRWLVDDVGRPECPGIVPALASGFNRWPDCACRVSWLEYNAVLTKLPLGVKPGEVAAAP
jgi:O-methyltransferase